MPTESQRTKVWEWLMKAPFDDPRALAAQPAFSYDDWLNEGRRLPAAVEVLIESLENEDRKRPSGNGMRVAYALGWIGERRPRAINALHRALESKDINLRIEAVAALGRLGDARVLPDLEKLLQNDQEDINVRGNACIAIGRLGVPSSEKLLRETAKSSDQFLSRCADEALRLHAAARASSASSE